MNASPLFGQFRISVAMRPYVLRVKLRGTDFDFGFRPEQAVAYTKCIGEMRRILVKDGRISAIAADRAILKTLEAAFDFQLAAARYRFRETSVGITTLALHVCGSGEQATAAFLRWLEITTGERVETYWVYIARVAALLLKRESLTGQDILSAMRRSAVAEPAQDRVGNPHRQRPQSAKAINVAS
jgi:hypothetical protein